MDEACAPPGGAGNNARALADNGPPGARLLLPSLAAPAQGGAMTRHRLLPLLALVACLAAGAADAACQVQYKAKRDNPLKLDFGTASLPDEACASEAAAAAALAPRLADKGWTLLAIVSIVPAG